MNYDEMFDLIYTSANLTDAGKKSGTSPSNLRVLCRRLGIDWTDVLNEGRGADLDRDRRLPDGFIYLTDWQRYRYKMACNENRIGKGTTTQPCAMHDKISVWVPSLNLEGKKI